MATERKAEVTGPATSCDGRARSSTSTSGALPELEVSWEARIGRDRKAQTSPEELIAAAQASCFAMALVIRPGAAAGTPPENSRPPHGRVRARRRDRQGTLTVRGTCPGSTPPVSTPAAEVAKANCPVSKALAGIPESRSTADARRLDAGRRWPPSRTRSTELERSYTEAQERHVRSRRLQRPPRGGRRRPAPEGARGPVQAGAGSGGRRAPTSRRRATTPSSPRWSPDYEAEVARLEEELKLSLAERDPADDKDVIVEIRQGVGGDEAALWAGDLARMLQRYAERRGFKWEELEVERRTKAAA